MISTRINRTASIFAAIALVAGAAAPSFAAPSDPSSEAKPARQDDGKEASMKKRVCIVQSTTGSILQKRECKTRGEWIAQTGVDPVKK